MNTPTYNILVVDDKPSNLHFFSKILTEKGYKVRRAISGQLALNGAIDAPPDLILLDIIMPHMDGYEVCRRLKATPETRDIPVIFLSALNEAFDKVKAFAVGGIDYVAKPFQVEEVLARIEIQLTVQRLSKLLKEQNTQLKKEVDFRQQTEEQLRHKSQDLANFSYHLKQLHRLNTTSYNNFEELFTDYIQTGCKIFSFPTGIISEVVNSTYKICAVESCFDFLAPNTIFALDDTCCAEVVDSKKTVAHAQINKIIPTLSPTVYWKPKSYFGTPIIVNGKIYGTLSFSSTQDRVQSFTSQEQELIELMAQDLGRLISNYQIQLKRQQAEKQLVLLKRAISASNNGIIISNAQEINHPIVYVNSGFEKITGYSEAEVLGKNYDFLYKDDLEQSALKELRNATIEGRECQVILRNYRKDGTLFWNEFSLTPVQDESGQVSHFISVQADITKRKHTELEIETKNAALKIQMLRKLLLTQITQEIRSSLDPTQIFQTAATEICKALGANRAIIHAYIEHPTPEIPFVGEYKEEGLSSIKGIQIPIVNNPHVQKILFQDQAVASDNVYQDPLLEPASFICRQIDLKSMLAVRTSYHGKPNGIIAVHQYDHYRHWDSDEIELIESVAAQVGIAIAQANLLQQERQRRQELAQQNQQLQSEIFNRQQVENALLQSEERWQILLKGNNDAIWDLNIETGEITFTQRWEEMLGYQEYEINNNNDQWLKCIHPDDFEWVVAQNQDYLDQKIPRYSIEYRLRMKDGSYKWILVRAQAVWNEQGKAIRMVGANTDITERKLVEEKLRDSQQKLSFLVQSAPVAVIERNLNGEVVTWNQAAENIFGYTATEAIGNIGVELLVPQNIKLEIYRIIKAVHSQKKCSYNINENLTKSGDIIICEWYDTPLLDEHGFVIGLVSIAIDITKRIQAEIALKEAKEAAEMASRAKSDFLSSMSHELRTPLNAILGFSQLLTRDNSLNIQQRENLGIINRSGEHLLALINDILSMSKIEAGQITLKENSFDLYWLLDSIQEMLQLKAQAKGLELSFERHLDIPQYIKTDESKLRQVLINLLGNAIKFTQKGSVLLRILPVNDPSSSLSNNGVKKDFNNQQMTIKFEVEDTGQGIAAEELSSLFDPFIQTQTGRQSMEGTGLGLPISRQFVNLMGGDIVVSSIFNQGSIFTFDIKITLSSFASMATTKPRMKEVVGLEANQPTYRILVVEDSNVNRLLLVKLLRPLGFEIKEAANGEEAIALWQTWQPHLIWMDIQMPIIDGYQATKAIKQMAVGHCNTVIIALTASAFEEQREAILKAGCDDFVRKPFRAEILLEKMALHLGVRYIYEQPKSPKLRLPLKKLQPQSLNVMPREWVSKIHQLAEACQDEEILALIEQIPEEYTDIKLALTDLVDNFRLDVIFDLSESLAIKSEE
jgi:two-component system sensor histidine kinase/response regulator